jgi:hypothetical protein
MYFNKVIKEYIGINIFVFQVMTRHQKYNDVKFFLVAIAFISAFNYYLTWSNINLTGFLFILMPSIQYKVAACGQCEASYLFR